MENKIPNEMKRPGKRKKYILLVSLALLGVGFSLLTSAIWALSLTTQGSYIINSEELKLGFTTDFSGAALDTTLSEKTFEDTAIVNNPGEDVWITPSIEIIKTDELNDTCTDFLEDCTINFTIGWTEGTGTLELLDGVDRMLKTGDTEIKAYVTCRKLSCPGTLETIIILDTI